MTTYPAYRTPEGLIVLGDYNSAGGLDSIHSSVGGRLAVRAAERLGPVLFEGSLASWCFEPWAALMEQLEQPFVWGYLDTPLDTCLQNIRERQARRGKPSELVRGGEQITRKYRSVELNREKAMAAGFICADLPHGSAGRWLRRFFLSAAGLELGEAYVVPAFETPLKGRFKNVEGRYEVG